MKKYNGLEFKIIWINNIDVITGSNDFWEDVNDNDIGNDGFIPFYY